MAGRKRKPTTDLTDDLAIETIAETRKRVRAVRKVTAGQWTSVKYAPQIGDEICERLAGGESLVSICADKHMPAVSTVFKWLADNEGFRRVYAFAREANGMKHGDQVAEIADDVLDGLIPADAARVAITAKTWLAERLAPNAYTVRQALELTGKDGGPVEIRDDRDFARRLAFSLAKGVYEPVDGQAE